LAHKSSFVGKLAEGKGPISSIGQAKEEMARLAGFFKQSADLVEQANTVQSAMHESIEALQAYFAVLDGVLGSGLGAQSKPAKSRLADAKLPVGRFRSVTAPDAPPSVHEAVLIIMKEIGKPVLPKQVALRYLMRNWPLPKKGTIYNLISGTVAYLYKRKGVLVKGQTGYTLKPHKDLSELVNAPILPVSPEEVEKRKVWAKAQYARKKAQKAIQAAELPFPPQEATQAATN
jgi:hypothetical protein